MPSGAISCVDCPSPHRLAVAGDDRFFMKRDGRANMPGDAVERVSDLEAGGMRRFDGEMFFTVDDDGGVEGAN